MPTKEAVRTIGEVIDHVEWLREELRTIQRALKKMESLEMSVSDDGTKKCQVRHWRWSLMLLFYWNAQCCATNRQSRCGFVRAGLMHSG
jgi:hypothetical protein